MQIKLLTYGAIALFFLAGCGQAATVPEALPAESPPWVPTSLLSPVALPTAVTSPTAIARPTSTPIPSATPEPTATPIIYVVEAGDTLLAVAVQHGISLDAVLLANPELRPELLQIGQQVIIPPPREDDQTAGLLPMPTPLPLAIGGTAWYTTPTGSLWFLGEVVNDTVSPVENVRLGVTVYSQEGTVLAERDSWAAADVLAMGDAAPFGMLFGPLAGVMSTYETHLLSSEPVTRDGYWHADLVIVDSDGAFEGPVYRVRGTVRNSGESEAVEIEVVATLYDADGRLTGFLQQALPDPLPPASDVSFDLWIAPVGPGTERYALVVSGLLQQEAG